MTDRGRTAEMLVDLVQLSHTTNLEALPRLVAERTASVGLHDSAMFLVDLQDKVMREVTGRGLDAGEGGEEVRVDGTLPGRAWQRVESIAESGTRQGRRRWWTPITDGVERLGVLRTDVAEGEQPQQVLSEVASVIALLLLSKRSFSDSYARLVRSAPMNVAAEMQTNLMPPPAYAGHNVTVGAVLEPAYDLGGDAFDFALAGTTLHLAVFDAMGHDTAAGITANVAVSACRNARRQGASLADASRWVERTLMEQFGARRYVTGILADLDTTTGVLTWINRGHHLPLLIRDQRGSTTLTCPPAGPMGTGLGLPITVCREQLQRGDRLVLYTDGVVEARDAEGNEFGRDRFVDFVLRHHSGHFTLHETLRRLMQAVLDHHPGPMDDDATVLLAEWRGGDQDVLVP
ncbi:PP2C family protein-serine/threonine phosphatase [Streptomyces fumanus]|uniref:PP2C family protein-serine/threonine phosphatase n=1 Tax=Streptomyces fumanus TaxID=67302 RepID=UPI001E31A179|nr:PP2C family protein-serine/threonine phosphatase [Streptomyces fumanus]